MEFGRDMVDSNFAIFEEVTDIVIFDIDVFGAIVMDRIMCDGDGRSIVAENMRKFVGNIEFLEELGTADCLSRTFG